MNTDNALVDIIFIDKYYLFIEFELKTVATSVFFTLRGLRRKLRPSKENLSLQILEYYTLCSELKTQI